MLVHIVSQHHHLRMTDEHISQAFQLGRGIGSARRVGRGVEQHPARLGRDRRFELCRRDLVVLRSRCCDKHRCATRKSDDIGIADPIGRRDDHFVARIDGRDERVEERVLAADIHADLGGRIVQPIVTLELGLDGGLQLGCAVDIGVFGLAVADGFNRGLFNKVRRIEIRLPCRQADHIDALCLQIQHTARHGERGGGLDTVKSGGCRAHVWALSFKELRKLRCAAPIGKQCNRGNRLGVVYGQTSRAGRMPRIALPMKNPPARSSARRSASLARPASISSDRSVPGNKRRDTGGVSRTPSRST